IFRPLRRGLFCEGAERARIGFELLQPRAHLPFQVIARAEWREATFGHPGLSRTRRGGAEAVPEFSALGGGAGAGGPPGGVSVGAGGLGSPPSQAARSSAARAIVAALTLILLSSALAPIWPSIPTLSWQSLVLAPPGAGPQPLCLTCRSNGDLWP